jgi:hypothetical protein
MARKARTPQRGDSATNEEKRVKEEAIEEAKRKLRPLTATVRSWAIINVNDPDPRHSPKDEYHAAVGFIHCLLDPDPEKSGDARQAADNFLGGFAPIVRKFILPALIPNPIDQNPWTHWRSPMDMMRQGWSTSLFHAAQQWSTRSS